MALRIEKIWGSVFGKSTVTRKDATDKEQPNQHQQQERQSGDGEKRPPADRQSVAKAIADLQAGEQFIQTGMKAEVVETKDGLTVRLTHASGAVVKIMTAEEFLKLRDASVGDGEPRGKILDQKF